MPRIPELKRQRIREEVKKGRSRYKVADELGVNFRTVYRLTEDLPLKQKHGRITGVSHNRHRWKI